MREIVVPLAGREYSILIGPGALRELGPRLAALGFRGRVALVQDAGAARHHGAAAAASLTQAGFQTTAIDVPAGEASKCLAQLGALWDAFAAAGLDRRSAVVTLGGGMIGDLGGFAAATYLRGIDFVQVPTTLLAQVDASVGGKTAIDLPAGKNLVGAFHQPRLVIADLATLRTLPEREYRAGLAEVIKYGVIADAAFFGDLESHREAALRQEIGALTYLVGSSCEIKAQVVGEDERESGLRAILNYGHTIGHAIETVAHFRYLHGECVSLGMVAAGRLAVTRGLLAESHEQRIRALLAAYGLPTALDEPLPAEAILEAMLHDKKTRSGELNFVLASHIGEVQVLPVPPEEALAAYATLHEPR
jgi:3-dehydroquinate synthase